MEKLTREQIEQIIKRAREKGERPALCGMELQLMFLGSMNFTEVDFTKANLKGAVLNRANLSRADFSEANLSIASFIDANLKGAILQKATLNGAKFIGTDLTGADLSGTDLQEVNLREAILRKANLCGTNLKQVILGQRVYVGWNPMDPGNFATGQWAIDVTAEFSEAKYDSFTSWPKGFDPKAFGAIKVD